MILWAGLEPDILQKQGYHLKRPTEITTNTQIGATQASTNDIVSRSWAGYIPKTRISLEMPYRDNGLDRESRSTQHG